MPANTQQNQFKEHKEHKEQSTVFQTASTLRLPETSLSLSLFKQQ